VSEDPKVTLTCRPRSPEAVADAVALVDPERNPDLQRRDVTGDGVPETFCNIMIHDVTALLECPVPRVRANDQLKWLRAGNGGWEKVTPAEALNRATKGLPVVVGWFNPKGHPGHIALVRATPAGQHGLWIAQAGRTNFSLGTLYEGFGSHAPLDFFAHS
jgi:hypothetical protein